VNLLFEPTDFSHSESKVMQKTYQITYAYMLLSQS